MVELCSVMDTVITLIIRTVASPRDDSQARPVEFSNVMAL